MICPKNVWMWHCLGTDWEKGSKKGINTLCELCYTGNKFVIKISN